MYIRNGAWGIISGFGNVEKNSEEDERGAAGECVSRQPLFFFRCQRQMGQRMNEENQEQDQKDEIAGKQEKPGQIVSEKVEKKREKKPKKKRLRIQGAAWRRLDNTAKLFAAVSGEDLSSVFRISAVLKEKVDPELLQRALVRTLPEFENFRVKLRKGFFWYYFETNNRNPGVEEEQSAPCRFIDPHRGARFPFRVSYYGCRINFEVFHGLTDGLGALRFASKLTEHYLELTKKLPVTVQEREFSPLREDDYLRHYRKLPHRHYSSRPAIAIQGEFLPFDQMAVLQGTIEVAALKAECRKAGVSITKYLAAALLWAIIQTETDGKTLKRPAAINLPVNLRSFFESETLANFFAVVNISWAAGKAPETLEEVIASVSRQMDEQIVKERLEETISYNVSNEKKWYVRAIPLFVKHLAMQLIFLHTSRAHTMTFSNIGPAQVREELKDSIEGFQLLVGASPKQRMKCGAVAYDGKLCLSFTSAMAENRLPEFFFHFLEEKGIQVERESNGITDTEHDKGRYPVIAQDRERVRRAVRGFYVSLVVVSLLAGLTNLATYHQIPFKWSLLTAGAAAYVAMTLRFSVMRHASLAGTLVRQSLGIQAILLLIDALTGLRGWSVDYAIPCVALFEVAAVLLMMLVNRMNWQSYFMYQITITFLSFVPLIFWKIGWTHHPLLTVLAAGVSVAALAATVILGDRSVKRELKRRFHV